jgi:hypothetical protein
VREASSPAFPCPDRDAVQSVLMDVGPTAEHEARSRLSSVLDVCEHEKNALKALEDDRLDGVLRAMTALRTEIAAALATLCPDSGNNVRTQP